MVLKMIPRTIKTIILVLNVFLKINSITRRIPLIIKTIISLKIPF